MNMRTDGHNVFLYHDPGRGQLPIDVDFGVEVTRGFDSVGEVYPTETPAGTVAMAVHLGAYERMKETHDAIHAWREANNRVFAGQSWEIYGDWSDDVSKLETTMRVSADLNTAVIPGPSNGPPKPEEMHNQRDHRENQQQVNQPARYMKRGPHYDPSREQYERQKKENRSANRRIGPPPEPGQLDHRSSETACSRGIG